MDVLYVVTTVSNPVRYQSRYRLYRRFAEHMAQCRGVKLVTVELAFGERPFEVTVEGDDCHVQLRTDEELWHKETALNIGIRQLYRLDPAWKYVAWVDADVEFLDRNWGVETVHALQHWHVVQPFSHCVDLGPQGESLATYSSFMSCYHRSLVDPSFPKSHRYGGPYWHTGYAWAATRFAVEHMGTALSLALLDSAILGSADHHMAYALVGRAEETLPGSVTDAYSQEVLRWQSQCERHIRRDVGYLAGTILHYFHGKKANRKYQERWQILLGNKFDPYLHLRRQESGLWKLNDLEVRLRDQIRAYFRVRNEDGIDV